MPGKGRWDRCDADFLHGREIDSADPNDGEGLTWNVAEQKLKYGPGGGSAPHALGGTQHTSSTLAELNTKLSDAALDAAGTARPPTAHGSTAHNENYVLGTVKLTVGAVAPADPAVNDLWLDTH